VDSQRTPRIVVVGGGINGLAAAWSAHEASGGRAEVWLLEAGTQVGGKARTRREDGWLVEEGPTGFLSGEPVLDELVARAGLEPLPADSGAARRYVVRGGRPREIVPTPPGFARSGLLSPLGLLRLAREPWVPRGGGEEESVLDFAVRRLGPQAAERLIAPMVLGVFAGDAARISLAAGFPRMAELEREHGSLFRAMFALARQRGRESGGPAGPRGHLTSFADGMQSLPLALAERAPFPVRTGAAVEALSHDPARGVWRFRVAGASGEHEADEVVLSCDARASARLLRPLAPQVADELDAIPIPPLAVVGLGYDSPRSVAAFPHGFGVLVPRGEGYRSLGVLFDDQLFPGRAPEGRRLVRVMLGGAVDPEAARLPEEELVRTAAGDCARLFGLPDAPSSYELVRWEESIPQYELGHLARVRRIDDAMARLAEHRPGLSLAGCHARGVAFGKTAAEGWRVGELAGRRRR
jgi:oxygen-dependent protoporphyrinogen oxidase